MASATVPLARWPRLAPGVALICLVVALSSTATGIVAPTYPLHARTLGLDLATIGRLPASAGLASLCLALPIGLLSDRIGRRWTIVGGIVGFALGMGCVGMADGPPLLLVGFLCFGAAGPATFQVGASLLGDVTPQGGRALAFGLYTTAMGAGFTIGPLVGGQVAGRFGTGTAFIVGAIIALATGGLALLALPRARAGAANASARPGLRGILALVRRPDLALACLGTLLMSWTFNGAIGVFFPLYGDALGLSPATIGTLFALRALVSAFGRLPGGMIARALGSRSIMLAALILAALALVALVFAQQTWILAVLLVCEGLAFGIYLVAGQTFIADRTTVENRGSAGGLYAVAGSIGDTAALVSLGVVADRWGLTAPFGATGLLLLIGVVAFAVGMVRSRNHAIG